MSREKEPTQARNRFSVPLLTRCVFASLELNLVVIAACASFLK